MEQLKGQKRFRYQCLYVTSLIAYLYRKLVDLGPEWLRQRYSWKQGIQVIKNICLRRFSGDF